MKIEYIRIKNFLCVGNDPLEIDFANLGKIVLIKGQNLDFHEESEDVLEFSSADDEYHSNGAGKSTISEAVVYGLYGSTIRKKVSHQDAINNTTKKKLEVEVIFTINDVRYRILRCRKPDSLRLWQAGPTWDDHNEITRGGQPTTQKQIEELLGMNHKAFVNVVCFGQHNDYNFLECPAAEQRAIAESLLSLEVYKEYSATAKEELKSIKAGIKMLVHDYEQMKSLQSRCESRISQIKQQESDWQQSCNLEINKLQQQLHQLTTELSQTDIGSDLAAYEKATEDAEQTKLEIAQLQTKQKEIEAAIEKVQSKQSEISIKHHDLVLEQKTFAKDLADNNKAIQTHHAEIAKLKKLHPGTKCPECYSEINPHNYKHIITLHQNKIDNLTQKNKALDAKIAVRKNDVGKYANSIDELKKLSQTATHKRGLLNQQLAECRNKFQSLSKIQQPDLTSRELVIQEKIAQAKKFIESKQQELTSGGPYKEIMQSATCDLETTIANCKAQKEQIAEVEGQLPYYDYWVKAFGDDGIRSFIIEGIVPALNSRIGYWLHYLINNKMTVQFDRHLNATIESNPPAGDPYAYFATCGGERKRINLAISQAFAYATMLSSGTWPSLVFLDEVSDSIDRRGIRNIYQMICELSAEKQVFVITHNTHLREMLEGVDTITVVRENGCTKQAA